MTYLCDSTIFLLVYLTDYQAIPNTALFRQRANLFCFM